MGSHFKNLASTTPPSTSNESPDADRCIRENIAGMRFSLMEVSGSLGDLGTFVPLILAITLTTGMDIEVILVLAGLANGTTGLYR